MWNTLYDNTQRAREGHTLLLLARAVKPWGDGQRPAAAGMSPSADEVGRTGREAQRPLDGPSALDGTARRVGPFVTGLSHARVAVE